MKTFTHVFVFIFSFFTLHSFAQFKTDNATIEWGPEYKDSKRSTLDELVAYDETGIYTLKLSGGGFLSASKTYLEHYDQEMEQTRSVKLEFKGKHDYHSIVMREEVLYLLSTTYDPKERKKQLHVQTINKQTLLPDEGMRAIAEIDFSDNKRHATASFDLDYSRDKSKVLVFVYLPNRKKEADRFYFKVLDNSFESIWEKDVVMEYEERMFNGEDFSVDNDGNVYVLGTLFKEKTRYKRKGKPNYDYRIISYLQDDEPREYKAELPGKFLTDMQIAINDDKDIICAGFYSDEGTFSIKGSYFLKIDPQSREVKQSSFKEFGIDFIAQNLKARQEKKTRRKAAKGKNVELYEYDLDDIILRSDGGAMLVGEQYYIRVVQSTYTDANGNMQTRTTYYYYYNDIILVNIGPDGEIDWMKKIPKRQVTTNDGGFYSSYVKAIVGKKIYFIFNDNPKNLTYDGSGKLHNFVKGKEIMVTVVSVDTEGYMERTALFTQKKRRSIITRPKVCEQVSKDEVVIYGQRKKKYQFAKVKFD